MAKDPAILFYTSDFLNGCACLTLEERGQYITMLCLQHQLGHLSEKVIKINVGSISEDVMRKFQQDENGLYYQKRMDDEINKRKGFTESRRANAKAYAKDMPKHMENENENENDIVIEKRKYNNIPPQLSEISARMAEREITSFTADAFYAFYESKGWRVGSQTMKNWDAALTTWNNREHDVAAKPTTYAPKYKTYDEMCQLALNNKEIWQQMTPLNLPDMPKTVWAHPNDVVKHNLTKYIVKK